VEIRRGSWGDFDAAYALIATDWSKPEHLRSRWELPSFDVAKHLWIAEDDAGKVIAYGALYVPDEAVVRGDPGAIPPLLERIEEQARAEGLERLGFVIPEWDEPAWRAYLDSGFELVTNVLEMKASVADTPAAAFPDGVHVRTYEAADAQRVHVLLDDAYAWDEAYVPMPHGDWVAWMTGDANFDPGCWWLAESNGDLAGVCLTWREGWVKDIATSPDWRGRGVGKALLLHALSEHRARGNRTVGLKVDDRNPTGAVALYERCGFRVERRYLALGKQL
jgi:GNAT superfamily N-acetyltransferase